MRLGAHISTASPFSAAIPRARAAGCECMQIFLNQPQRWNPSIIPERELTKFVSFNQENGKESPIFPIISHSIYLIGLAGKNPFFYQASQKSLIDEMKKAVKLGLLGVNTHLGSSKDQSFAEVKDKVSEAIKNVLAAVPEGPDFLIENSAGAGNVIGDTVEEIGEVVKSVGSPRLKVVIDTAHAFESGYPIETKTGLEEFLDRFERAIGLERLVGLHLNDSATAFNSKRDRHADIGEGEIGMEAFARIVHHPKLKSLFGIIETPTLKSLATLREL